MPPRAPLFQNHLISPTPPFLGRIGHSGHGRSTLIPAIPCVARLLIAPLTSSAPSHQSLTSPGMPKVSSRRADRSANRAHTTQEERALAPSLGPSLLREVLDQSLVPEHPSPLQAAELLPLDVVAASSRSWLLVRREVGPQKPAQGLRISVELIGELPSGQGWSLEASGHGWYFLPSGFTGAKPSCPEGCCRYRGRLINHARPPMIEARSGGSSMPVPNLS